MILFHFPSLQSINLHMAEELQESEESFADRRQCRYRRRDGEDCFNKYHRAACDGRQSEKEMAETATAIAIANSLPVRIPGSVGRRTVDEEDDEMVPPHVMAERRLAGKMAFSVCTGNGRTLKGRDLSRVRNSILRMTGFLET